MSLLDLLKPRKVLLLHSDDPNVACHCCFGYDVGADICPYLDQRVQPLHFFCNKYKQVLTTETSTSSRFINRCDECEQDKII